MSCTTAISEGTWEPQGYIASLGVAAITAKLEEDTFEEAQKLHTYFNDSFECSGYCKRTLFTWETPIEKGRPEETCRSKVAEELGSIFSFLASACIAGSLITTAAFIA